jgi:hypothetical protein
VTRLTTCGFCGFEFDPDQAETACPACPLARGCRLVCCPRCGYQMPPEAKLVGWLRNFGKDPRSEKLSSSHYPKLRQIKETTRCN